MSDTPRTDRRIITQHPKMCGCFYSAEIINADFARQLERELNAAKAENEVMKKAIKTAADSLDGLDLHLPRNHGMFLLLALEKLQPFLK